MKTVIVQYVTAPTALELRDQLLDAGLIQNQDFEWAYHPQQFHDMAWQDSEPRHVEFKFRDDKLATFYSLKWANRD